MTAARVTGPLLLFLGWPTFAEATPLFGGLGRQERAR